MAPPHGFMVHFGNVLIFFFCIKSDFPFNEKIEHGLYNTVAKCYSKKIRFTSPIQLNQFFFSYKTVFN